MGTISLNIEYVTNYIDNKKIDNYQEKVSYIHDNLLNPSVDSDQYLGWIDYSSTIDTETINDIHSITKEIQELADVLVVIGIGGSFLGAKAIQDAMGSYFPVIGGIEVVYAGNQLSSLYIKQLLTYIQDKEVYVNVISKSGTTTEPTIAFRVLREFMEDKYKDEANSRIIVTTDEADGLLKALSIDKNYRTLSIPKNIGGRYSVFTPVGLLPIAVAGSNISSLLRGASQASLDLSESDLAKNISYKYAVIRHHLFEQGYFVELLATFEPCLKFFQEWWKQLFAESEGKGKSGIFPSAAIYSTDLHSIGQYVQDGSRILFETILHIEENSTDINLPYDKSNMDNLNYLIDKTLNEINTIAKNGTMKAHSSGKVPIIEIIINKLDEYHLGYLIYFFMKSCAMSAYLNNVNPFNQPGVEEYKNNMSCLLEQSNYVSI